MSMIGIRVADLEVLPDTLVEQYQKRIKKGKREFLDKIVLHNMKLVIHLAHQYYPPAGYDYEDLVMAGTPGLYSAARRWKRIKGASFGTYASYHIRARILRFIQKNSHMVNVPYRFNDELSRAHHEKRNLEALLGHGVNSDDDRLSKRALRTFKRTVQCVSIDGAMDPETGEPCSMELPDPAPAPVLSQEEVTVIHNLLKELPLRLQNILRARFGFDQDDIPTLEDLAARMGITRERVRQLEMVGLCKLKRRLEYLNKRQNLQLLPR
jgi:RNA polymerase nonessential primary-like sigma factor